MRKLETYNWIERYLAGELTGEELSNFELRLQTDPALAEQLQQYREVTDTLQFYGQRKSLQQKLNAIHAQSFEPQTKKIITPFSNKQKRKIFWNQHYATIAVAASVALLTVIGTLFSVDL